MLTPAQQQAVTASGNVLVMAGAGTGKTRTLVERVLRVLAPTTAPPEDPEAEPVRVTDLLVVTFTEAAAAELRERIRQRLETVAARDRSPFWQEQLALLDSAFIGTLHSFCYRIISEHYAELDLDPKLSVLDVGEALLRSREVFHELLEQTLADTSPEARAFAAVFADRFAAEEARLRDLVLRIHAYSQSLADPEGWFESQRAYLQEPNPTRWRQWLLEALAAWRARWQPVLQEAAADNPLARCCQDHLLTEATGAGSSEELARCWASAWQSFQLALEAGRQDRTILQKHRAALRSCLEELEFLASLLPNSDSSGGQTERLDPLEGDWQQMRQPVLTLLWFSRRFGAAYALAKRQRGELDFADLEQMALTLLWDRQRQRPRPLAERFRERFRWVFVDEYQDINPAQDQILCAVSRSGDASNRFLVGDIKQSIYRFRRADPTIFRNYAEQWARSAESCVVQLTENFRSRPALLDFVNAVFSELMRPEVGGVGYGPEAWLRSPDPSPGSNLAASEPPPVELQLWTARPDPSEVSSEEALEDEIAAVEELSHAEREARFLALRLKELQASQVSVRDPQTGQFRPVRYSDMAVLMRSPGPKIELYARQFDALGVPLEVARKGLFEALEVADLVNLLRLLDNPLQDLPLLAVLRSPLVGLSLDELACICSQERSQPVWLRLRRWLDCAAADRAPGCDPVATRAAVARFLQRYARWRALARQGSVSRCLEAILSDTHYLAWVEARPQGRLARWQLERALQLARQYDRFSGEGLRRFLERLDAFEESAAEPEVPSAPGSDAVRLLSIHQSKGLEFPVVVVADLGKPFNWQDLRDELILDEYYGLAARLRSTDGRRTYPSLSYWLARQRQKAETLGEELRLLYVAFTRARDHLILSGMVRSTPFGDKAASSASSRVSLLDARCPMDWLIRRFRALGLQGPEAGRGGAAPLFRWEWQTAESWSPGPEPLSGPVPTGETPVPFSADENAWAWVWTESTRLSQYAYPWRVATHEPAKTSVTTLHRRAWEDELLPTLFGVQQGRTRRYPRPPLTAAERGTAHHRFLGLFDLGTPPTVAAFCAEAQRLFGQGQLTQEELEALEPETLVRFWSSELGQQLCRLRACVRRELSFTVALEANEIRAVLGQPPDPALAGETIVVQGAADLVLLLPEELWLLDFKTDRLQPAELEARVRHYTPQLQLYARALSRIYGRPAPRLYLHFLALGETVQIPQAPASPPNWLSQGPGEPSTSSGQRAFD